MREITVLDCTLRDGGYCNEWNFGLENARKIVAGLLAAGVGMIELGFLTDRAVRRSGVTKFRELTDFAELLPEKRRGKLFLAMLNCGEYDVRSLPPYDGSSIDGIRVAFHKKDAAAALADCRIIKEKGYQIFVQPMVTLCYSDEELSQLIRDVNELEPHGFYMVDSFGMMKRKDMLRLFYNLEHKMKESICIGFHSHNNMQLSFANAQILADMPTNRNLLVDCTVFGMGRGAGNLNTELFLEYLNDSEGERYKINPLLRVIDEVLGAFYRKNYWGYSLPNYLSAMYNTHPNYTRYLEEKETLTVENMEEIFAMMQDEKRAVFDKDYMEALYVRYMTRGVANERNLQKLKEELCGKSVLLIAPGGSCEAEREKIAAFSSQSGCISISVNFAYEGCRTDFIFVSNLRRFRSLPSDKREKCIVTSNISADQVYAQTDYQSLLNDTEMVRDNAGLMLIRFLVDAAGVKDITLAGFDGYTAQKTDDCPDRAVQAVVNNAIAAARNQGMNEVLARYAGEIPIYFLTEEKHLHVRRGMRESIEAGQERRAACII